MALTLRQAACVTVIGTRELRQIHPNEAFKTAASILLLISSVLAWGSRQPRQDSYFHYSYWISFRFMLKKQSWNKHGHNQNQKGTKCLKTRKHSSPLLVINIF